MINYVAPSLDAHKRITLEWKGADSKNIVMGDGRDTGGEGVSGSFAVFRRYLSSA